MDWDGAETGFTTITPNGMEIRYEPKGHKYWVNKVEVDASATHILRVLDKPALTWWGMNVGIAAGLEMYERAGITPQMLLAGKPEDMDMLTWAKEISKTTVTEMGLTTNHIRDQASTRGQTVHTAFSYWATTGLWPIPGEYPEHESGYVVALIAFLRAVPTLEPRGIELAVGSEKHSFAGRYDLRGVLSAESKVVTRVYPKVEPKFLKVPTGTFLFDLKTSVDIFAEHSLQLAGYELASVESGYEPTTGQLIVQLGADGRYQCRRARSSAEDFIAVKRCWKALRDATEGLKIQYR